MLDTLNSRRIYKYNKYDRERSRWACLDVTLHYTGYGISSQVHVYVNMFKMQYHIMNALIP